MENSFVLVIGNQIMPLDIHAVAADAAGNLVEVDWDDPVHFSFPLKGWQISACLSEAGRTRLALEADLGPLPFTAEAREVRAGLQAIVEAANGHLGPVLRITDGRHIKLDISGVPDRPLTAVSLVASVTRLLAPVTPYLDLLAVFLSPSGGRGPSWRPRARLG